MYFSLNLAAVSLDYITETVGGSEGWCCVLGQSVNIALLAAVRCYTASIFHNAPRKRRWLFVLALEQTSQDQDNNTVKPMASVGSIKMFGSPQSLVDTALRVNLVAAWPPAGMELI